MKYFVLTIIFCSGLSSQIGLREKDNFIDEKKFNSDNESYKQDNHVLGNQLPKPAVNPCSNNPCKNGGDCVLAGASFICKCKKPYGGKTCSLKCDCGPNGQCSFSANSVKCICKERYAEKKGKCESCYCGIGSEPCYFNWNGDKVCICRAGYALLYGQCNVCDCGAYGKCTFKDEVKTCDCKHGAEDINGTCTVCDCGPDGVCTFENGLKMCYCKEGFEDMNGTCVAMETTSSDNTTVVTPTILPSTADDLNGTCSKDNDCYFNQKCSPSKDGWNTCVCADGLYGDACDQFDWCNDTEKFINCKYDNGTCLYSIELRTVLCKCDPGKKFKPDEKRCRETCLNDGDCKNGGRCEEKNFCYCKLGVIGDKCQTVFDCTTEGKYKGCTNSSGTCSFDGNKVVCECPENKIYDANEHICKDCSCGSFSYSCFLDSAGNKACSCFKGYSQLGGTCVECNCGPYGTCSFEFGQKKCNCRSFATERNGSCVAICNEDNCVHGKCEIIRNDIKCSCYEGYIGRKCEDKIEPKSNKQDLWKILEVVILFAIFILLSGGLCIITRLMSKMSLK